MSTRSFWKDPNVEWKEAAGFRDILIHFFDQLILDFFDTDNKKGIWYKERAELQHKEISRKEQEKRSKAQRSQFKSNLNMLFTLINEQKPQQDVEMPYVEESLEVEPAQLEQPVESVQVEEYQEDSSSPGFFARLSSMFSRDAPTPEYEPIENVHVDDMKNDLKFVASNFVGLMEQMGHRNRERVKNTEEFAEIKEIFKKHSIIK